MKRASLSISVRRHFVDTFFQSHASLIKDKDVVDLGGKKENKRGLFSADQYAKRVTYVNLDKSTSPDLFEDVAHTSLASDSFDIAILGEVLEHVPNPKEVLKEAHRLLRPGGRVLASVPFLFPVHADPYDFGRYTDYYWQEAAKELGFTHADVRRQGAFFAILALMVQHFFRAKHLTWRPIQTPLVRGLMWLDSKTKNELLRSWTTGYGIVLTK